MACDGSRLIEVAGCVMREAVLSDDIYQRS